MFKLYQLYSYVRLCSLKHGFLFAARHRNLITLAKPTVYSCVVSEKFLPSRESVTETVLEAGKAVLGMSSYIGMQHCTFFSVSHYALSF